MSRRVASRVVSLQKLSYSALRDNVLSVMKSAAILLPHSVILNAPFVVVYLSLAVYISFLSLHNVYFRSDSGHVRSGALLRWNSEAVRKVFWKNRYCARSCKNSTRKYRNRQVCPFNHQMTLLVTLFFSLYSRLYSQVNA